MEPWKQEDMMGSSRPQEGEAPPTQCPTHSPKPNLRNEIYAKAAPSAALQSMAATSAAKAVAFHGRRWRPGPSVVREASRRSRGWGSPAGSSCLSFAAEGPSCLFVGPLETASQQMLEALYHQARDSYYSGQPLIVDDMFDKVELKLRRYGSKSVVKYPRCSLLRQSTYADAEEDPSMAFALAGVWMLLLTFGGLAFLVLTGYSISLADKDVSYSISSSSIKSPMEWLTMVNAMLFTGLGCLISYPIASSSVQALKGLWRRELVALKGSCPNCGEEVFAFVKAAIWNLGPHKTECHVCGSRLEFRTKVEKSISNPEKLWVYGRIYLIRRRRLI